MDGFERCDVWSEFMRVHGLRQASMWTKTNGNVKPVHRFNHHYTHTTDTNNDAFGTCMRYFN